MAPAAFAGRGDDPPPAKESKQPESGDDLIGSRVTFSRSGSGNSGEPLTPAQSSWKPPVCWYEPQYTPEEYDDWWGPAQVGVDSGKATLPGESEEFENPDDFLGKKGGVWWERVYNPAVDSASLTCGLEAYHVWVPDSDPQPPTDAISAEDLSKLAYDATRLPAPPVTLSPAPDRQVVNLETYAKFDAPLDQVWVTASIDHMGYSVAATTVATPESLTVNAGTEYAEPSSCTYDLAKSGDGYKVDSKGSDCNITYRRSSQNDSYELTAELTWRVHWTASADPGGPPQQPALPDGTSSTTEDVVVKEVQSINR